jgi:hypothetical protein
MSKEINSKIKYIIEEFTQAYNEYYNTRNEFLKHLYNALVEMNIISSTEINVYDYIADNYKEIREKYAYDENVDKVLDILFKTEDICDIVKYYTAKIPGFIENKDIEAPIKIVKVFNDTITITLNDDTLIAGNNIYRCKFDDRAEEEFIKFIRKIIIKYRRYKQELEKYLEEIKRIELLYKLANKLGGDNNNDEQ